MASGKAKIHGRGESSKGTNFLTQINKAAATPAGKIGDAAGLAKKKMPGKKVKAKGGMQHGCCGIYG